MSLVSVLVASMSLFSLTEVELKNAPDFTIRVQADRDYVLALECDRLLAPFVREAGLPAKAQSYGNWESCGLDGHTLGHYLSALSNLIASGNDKDGELKRRLDYCVSELARCQRARGDGSCDGVPGSREMWRKLKENHDWRAIHGKWVPWYNLHKTYAGLLAAWELTGNRQAKEVYDKMVKWADWVTRDLSEQEMQAMVGQETGGINEVLPGELGKRFDHKHILDPLRAGRDELTGKHANTQIPKIVGFAAHGYWDAASFFWDTVVQNRSVAFGGNSVDEHFHATDDFKRIREERAGPETCNTHNMLKLTERLFCHDPQPKYAQFYERALFNHLLSAANPSREHPGFVYFTSLRPAHYRVYSVATNGFWCCTGTGIENPGKYGKFIYSHDGDDLYVNLWIDSELKGRLRQTTRYPYADTTTITVLKPFKGDLFVRCGDTYKKFSRTWKKGDAVTVKNPAPITVEMLPDNSGWGAIMAGNILLGVDCGRDRLDGLYADDSRMGHVAWGPMQPLDRAVTLIVKPEELGRYITREGPLTYRLSGKATFPATKEGLVLKPFFNLHECRYQIYWEFATPEAIAARKARLAAVEANKVKRDTMTLDVLTCGEQQPETEHDLKASGDSATGLHSGRHWRHGNWFEYTLNPRGAAAAELVLMVWGGDSGREFTVKANGTEIGIVKLDGGPGRFEERRFTIPRAVLKAAPNGKITIRFEARKWLAGGVYEVRLVQPGCPTLHDCDL